MPTTASRSTTRCCTTRCSTRRARAGPAGRWRSRTCATTPRAAARSRSRSPAASRPGPTRSPALRALGVAFTPVAAAGLTTLDPARDALIVGSAAWDAALTRDSAALRSFLRRGGRALVLDQRAPRFDASWLPGGLRVQTRALDHPHVFPGGRPFAQGMAINPERPAHPAFDGLPRDRFFLWSDYTGWTESKPGFPAVYPVAHGLALTKPDEMGDVALLADYDHGLQGVALAELFVDCGSALVSAFDVVERVGLDPAADRLLLNMVRYTAGDAVHHAHPLIDSKITWGDYASERGLVVGIHSGLIVHTVPRVPPGLAAANPLRVDPEGFVFAGGSGGWNTKPAIQYFPRGRRPYGPYEFTTGGSVRPVKVGGGTGVAAAAADDPEIDAGGGGTLRGVGAGEGRVWMRVPAGRTMMLTTIENPHDQPLELEITLNGASTRHRVGARGTARLETPIPGNASGDTTTTTTLAITYRGDRRLVLL